MPRNCATPLQFETFVLKAISSSFPKQIDIYKVTKMAEGD